MPRRLMHLAALSLLAPTAAADIITLNPSADSFVASALPANNYGAAGGLAIAAPGLPNGEFQSLLRFDSTAAVATLNAAYGAGQWTITSVSLRLTATAPNNAIFNPQAAGSLAANWMQNDSWTEGTGTPAVPSAAGITFATLPGFLSTADQPLGSFAFGGATSGTNSYALALNPSFTTDLSAGGLVSLRLFAADSTIAYVFNSANFGSVPAKPALIMTAVPEPAAGLLLLAALPRRRRSRGSLS